MTTILFTAINAILPIILLILLGYFLRKRNFISEDFVKTGNNFVFKACLPSMLFINVYNIEGFRAMQWNLIAYAVIAVFVLFFVSVIVALFTTKEARRRGVIMQAIFRSNFAIIGLSLAGALGGDDAIAVAACISAFTIPLFNVLAVIALNIFMKRAGEKGKSIQPILMNIVKNPLIIGVLLGFACLAIRTAQVRLFGEVVFSIRKNVPFFYTAINNLKTIASPLALVVLGGQFEFSAVKGMWKDILVGTLGRIVVAPIIGIGGAAWISCYTNWLSCGPNEYPALIALFGTPVAVSSAIMAGAMDNDEQLAAQLVVWTSIFSIVSLFVIVCILMSAGFLLVA